MCVVAGTYMSVRHVYVCVDSPSLCFLGGYMEVKKIMALSLGH